MDISVTRRHRGKKDTKGNIVSEYNYKGGNSSTSTVQVLKSAPIIEQYQDPLRTSLTDFVLCINFIDLVPLEYSCPDDMYISEQTYELDVADLLVGSNVYTLEDFLPQFTKLSIIPNDLGVVLLIGKMKSSSVKTFTSYIEVRETHLPVTIKSTSAPLALINTTTQEIDLLPTIQTPSGTSITFDWLSGYKGVLTLTGDTTLTVTNLPDGCEGQIEITNGATAYTFNLNGSTGYTTEVVMGNNAAIDSTINSHTTLIFWRSGSTLYYGYLYIN